MNIIIFGFLQIIKYIEFSDFPAVEMHIEESDDGKENKALQTDEPQQANHPAPQLQKVDPGYKKKFGLPAPFHIRGCHELMSSNESHPCF